MLAIIEAIHSVALSHEEGCGCWCCLAAAGDDDVMQELLIEAWKP